MQLFSKSGELCRNYNTIYMYILLLVKKNPFPTAGQIKNTIQEVSVSKSTIKRRLHQSKFRCFTIRCKPVVSLKNRKTRLDLPKKI